MFDHRPPDTAGGLPDSASSNTEYRPGLSSPRHSSDLHLRPLGTARRIRRTVAARSGRVPGLSGHRYPPGVESEYLDTEPRPPHVDRAKIKPGRGAPSLRHPQAGVEGSRGKDRPPYQTLWRILLLSRPSRYRAASAASVKNQLRLVLVPGCPQEGGQSTA